MPKLRQTETTDSSTVWPAGTGTEPSAGAAVPGPGAPPGGSAGRGAAGGGGRDGAEAARAVPDRAEAHALEPAAGAPLRRGAGGDQPGREEDVEPLGRGVLEGDLHVVRAGAPDLDRQVAGLAG